MAEKSIFDAWMIDGKFDSDAYRRAQIADTVNGLYTLSTENVDVTPPEHIKTSMELIEWFAENSRKLAELGKKFVNGKRQIVYYCTVYTLGLRDPDEKREILKALPALFNYELGTKRKTVSGAWKDILSNCNGYTAIAKDVGLGIVPQTTFKNVSQAITWCMRYYPKQTHARRVQIRKWFCAYYTEHNGFGLDKVNATTLTELYREHHTELTHPDRLSLYGDRKTDANNTSKAEAVLSSGKNAPTYAETSAEVQTKVREKLAHMGIPLIVDKDLTRLAGALEIDVTRSDAMGDITQALEVCGTVKARLHSMLEQARVCQENTKTPVLPSIDMSKADFGKMFKLAQPLDGYNGATVAYRDRKLADIVFKYIDSEETIDTVVPVSTFYKFRRENGLGKKRLVSVKFS